MLILHSDRITIKSSSYCILAVIQALDFQHILEGMYIPKLSLPPKSFLHFGNELYHHEMLYFGSS